MFRRVKSEIFYPYPPQQVWQVLTDRQALAAWLMENDFEPRIGHKFQFRTNSLPGLDGIIYCQVLELDEPKRLAYTWCDSLIDERAIVTWTLEAVEGGTQLHLHHRVVERLYTIPSARTWDGESMAKSKKATQMLLSCDRNIPTGYSLPSALSRSRQLPGNSFKPVATTFYTQSSDEWDYRLQQLPKILMSLAFNNK